MFFNDLIEFGEEIDIDLIIENVGQFNADDVNVEVTSDDSYISINNGISTIDNVNPGEIVYTETPINFSILNSVPDGHLAQFHVVLTGEEEWQFNFTVEIHSPVFEIMNPTIVDENNDGVWDPGETASIMVDLVNSGSAAFYQYPGATITTNNENIQILENFKKKNKKKLKVVHIPMPKPKKINGTRVPASYLNFYIANKLTYNLFL